MRLPFRLSEEYTHNDRESHLVGSQILLSLDKQSYSPHIGARDFCWHGWGHEEAGRSCGAGGTAVAGRAVAATRGTSGRSGAAAGREPNLGWTVGRRAQVERCGWLAQSAAHRAAAAADRG